MNWVVGGPLKSRYPRSAGRRPMETTWRRRGEGDINARDTRRLLAQRHPRVYHVYDTVPHEHSGPGLDALVAYLEEFWTGHLDPMDHFRVGEFRSPEGDVMLV